MDFIEDKRPQRMIAEGVDAIALGAHAVRRPWFRGSILHRAPWAGDARRALLPRAMTKHGSRRF